MKEIQQMRKLAVKLTASGTIETVSQTALYCGGFGFVWLQVYVPKTQQRDTGTSPLCTVYRTVTDARGNRKTFNKTKYNLLYIETDGEYMLFERPMPRAFTDTVGELDLVFEYSEISEDSKVVSRIVSNEFHATVCEGSNGTQDDELEASLTEYERSQIADNTTAIEKLVADIQELTQPPDCTEADNVGTPEVAIVGNRFKFSNLKGEKGDSAYAVAVENGYVGTEQEWLASLQGEQGIQGADGEKGDKGDRGLNGLGVYGFTVENGNLIQYAQVESETAQYGIDTDGQLKVTINY